MPSVVSSLSDPNLITTLLNGGIVVLRTDTLYGILCKADNEQAVQRVYDIKRRDAAKSPIVLLANQSQLYEAPPASAQPVLEKMWPGPYSIVLPATHAPTWIIRENGSVAYRIPAYDSLRYLLEHTGPLIAPSANPEGQSPALTVEQAVGYFGEHVDMYVDGGAVTDTRPSTLLRFNGSTFDKLR